MTFPPLIIWAKALFFFEQLFPVVARTWLESKSECLFFGPKFWFLAQKSDFCHTTPILVDDPFLALGMTVNFPPWKRFFDFLFRSYSCFRKKIRLTAQKVFPPPNLVQWLIFTGERGTSKFWGGKIQQITGIFGTKKLFLTLIDLLSAFFLSP